MGLMVFFCDQINLFTKADKYQLISFDGIDLGEVEISSILPSIHHWINVKACIDNVCVKNVYLNAESCFIRHLERIDLLDNDSVCNAKLINYLSIKCLFKDRDYNQDTLDIAKFFFKTSSPKEKIDSYIQLSSKTENIKEKDFLKNLIKDFLVPLLNKNWMIISLLPEDLKDDKEFILPIIIKNGMALDFVSANLKDDIDIVIAAVSENSLSFNYASTRLKNNIIIALVAVNQSGSALRLMSDHLKDDPAVVLAAVTKNGKDIQYASPRLINDQAVVLAAVIQDESAIQFASEFLKNDREFILMLMQYNGKVIEYIAKNLKDDTEIFTSALLQISSRIISKILKPDTIISVNQIKLIIKYYIRNKNNKYLFSKIAEDYILSCIEGRSIDFLEKKKNHIKSQIKKDSSIKANKNDYYLYVISNLEKEAFYLEEMGLKDPKILRIIFPFIKTIINYKNKEIRLFFLEIIEFFFKKNMTSFLEKLVKFSELKKDLILPSFILSSLDVSLSTLCELDKIFKNKIKSLLNKSNKLLHSLILLWKKLKECDDCFDDEKIVYFIKNSFLNKIEDRCYLIEDDNEIITRLNMILFIVNIGLDQFKIIDDYSSSNILDLSINKLIESGVLENSHETKYKFREYFLKSRIPYAIFSYYKSCISYEEMILPTKIFIEGVIKDHYLDDRHNNNSHKHLLNETQKIIWESGAFKKNDLKIIDTEDWQDLFFCGSEVVGSCQKVDGDPDYNKCLLGYLLDGKIRMIKIEKEDGSILARSIIKIMKDSSNRPVLFLERIYPDDRYALDIKGFAKERAEALGVSLYEYDNSSNKIILQSEGNIAPFEYEDGGIGVTDGFYMLNAKFVD